MGLAALALGIILAWRYGESIGAWFGLEEMAAQIVGFVIVLVVVVLGVWLIGRVTRGLFRIAGLGIFDNFLGVAFSVLKIILFIGLFVMVFRFFDGEGRVISPDVLAGSVMWGAVDAVCDVVFPFFREWFNGL